MKGFQLAANYGRTLTAVKILALAGGFSYVRILHFSVLHGPEWLYWSLLGLLSLSTIVLYLSFGGTPYRQEKQYLVSLGIDLLALCYLFLLHPETILAMLIGLVLVVGFYNFVLPRTSGMLVGIVCVFAYACMILLGIRTHVGGAISLIESMANAIVGLLILGAVTILVRRLKRAVDSVYTVTDSLTLELTSQTIDAELSNDVLMERNNEVNLMIEILSQIVAVLDWEELFANIMKSFRGRFEFDKFCIYLYNAETTTLDLEVESGGERATGVSTSVKPDHGIVGWCFSHGKGVLLNDVRNDKRYSEFNERGKKIRSIACQPLIFRGEKLGVLCLDSHQQDIMDEKGFTFLQKLSPLIAIAVSNSLSYRMVKAESNTDHLTGLYNHRGFMEKFLLILDSTYREQIPLGFLIMDIDNFKMINDTYGHMVGNLILTELAQILTGFFRSADVVARWGGEEFVVVLYNAPPDIAPRICEQLRRKIESHQFPISLERDTFKQVTVSLGLASSLDANLLPEQVSGSRRGDPDIFIKNVRQLADVIAANSDEAMYVAKREGKNTLRLSFHYPQQEPAEWAKILNAGVIAEENGAVDDDED